MLEWRIVGSRAHLCPVTASSALRLCRREFREDIRKEPLANENAGVRRCSICYQIAYRNKMTIKREDAA